MSSGAESDSQIEGLPRKKAKVTPIASKQRAKLGKRPREPVEEQETNKGSKVVEASEGRIQVLTSSDGESYIEIGKQKRITVRQFKGKVLVDIREYYGKEGEERPGKKGISLNMEQWQALTSASDLVDGLISQIS